MSDYKTYSQKPAEVDRQWILIDAKDATLGRIANTVSKYLVGKYKPTYTPHVDGGDYVVVINASELIVTGDKEADKKYHSYSGFPGGLKTASLKELREKSPEKIIEEAVKGMLPKNKLSPERLKRLKVFAGEEHTHTAQKPQKVEVK